MSKTTCAILRDFPSEFESERLRIRCPLPGDGRILNEAVQESKVDLARWLPWAEKHETLAASEATVRTFYADFVARRDLPFFLFLKDSGEFAGGAGLHRIDWTIPRFEIGYWLRSCFHGRGLMTEAVRRIERFAFEQLEARRLEIRVADRNADSWRIPERLGYNLEGILRNQSRTPAGELYDIRLYARVRADEP